MIIYLCSHLLKMSNERKLYQEKIVSGPNLEILFENIELILSFV